MLAMDKYERRRLRLIELRDILCNGSNAEMARRLKKTDSYVARMLYPSGKDGRKRIGEDMADAIDEGFEWPLGTFDSERPIAEIAREAMHTTAAGGLRNRKHKEPVIESKESGSSAKLTLRDLELAPEINGKLPLISWEQAATWEILVDNITRDDAEEWLLSGHASPPKGAYHLRVRGHSMHNPAGFPSFRDADLIEVWPCAEAGNEDLIVAQPSPGAELVFRQLIVEGGKRYLQALNPGWPDRIVEMMPGARIYGKITSQITRFSI